MDIQNTVHVNSAFTYAQKKAISYRHEFITPEHLLSAFLEQSPFANALNMCFCDTQELAFSLENYFTEELESVPADMDYELEVSTQLNELIQHAYLMIDYSSAEALNVPHLVQSMLQLKDSWACHILKEALEEDLPEFISQLISRYEEVEEEDDLQTSPQEKSEPWRNFVTCLNDCLQDHNPLIGREAELERTIQVLCRKEKNNPLHVGEPGVGKTSLAYGLAARIEAREVPERLLDCRIYELDLGTLLAGTQYRGDFEKRLKTIMEGVRNEGRAIIYIDEIHNLIGAGRTGDGSMDASNMLKPYLESGDIRFIGSTTYEEYNRYFARSKGLVRRFQQIDILEPSIEETIHIVEGLKEKYEEFHGVTYHPDVIPYAVKASVRYISDRFLPDKAIDLVDEAGAYREIHPIPSGEQIVDKTLITDVLARICKVDALAMKEEDTTSLETLHARISAKIYGQEEAVRRLDGSTQVSLADIATKSMCGSGTAVQATCSHTSPISPPPFMVGMAEVEVDRETGSVQVLDYTAVVDCGTPINPNLARVQTEGGIVQGIGMALFEDVTYTPEGRILEDSLMQYKLPTRLDMGHLRVEFESSYEKTGPFGAKSIGEIVINTPAPALAQAIFRATGTWHRNLPITPEKVLLGRDE